MRAFKAIFRNDDLLLLLFVPVYAAAYFCIESISPIKGYSVIYTLLDSLIPFIPIFIFPYLLWYPYLIINGIYLWHNDRILFQKYVQSLILGSLISLLLFVIFPSIQELRPKSFEFDSISINIIKRLYSVDTNTNVFPSMHVIGTLIALFSVTECKDRTLAKADIVWAILICCSTVFIKQHSILDVVAAIVISYFVYILVFKIKSSTNFLFKGVMHGENYSKRDLVNNFTNGTLSNHILHNQTR